eukprot:CAMPEP_0202699682 /NCGR_PEP_ID=MMETSP1385-20130828/12893_1 /ASSEMBLY_ACC=CAM_ASM_000861 /TAXON_ID=933848 /ORGANISM="Elphidium margaritaceum" /LENGTH=308 /DNA_ID=CAMNT_0049356675 /DNA_START=43 /DNA_END=969 /DNA_ORIENTATION=-
MTEEKSSNAAKKYGQYDAPIELERALNDKDEALLKKVNAKYGDRIKNLYPYVIRTFITGYAHTAEEQREQETYNRIDHFLERYNEFHFETILNEPMKDEQKMFEAWRLYTYGYDKQGHPVLYDEIGSADIKSIESVFHNDIALLREYRFRFHRRLANCKRIQSEKMGCMLYKHAFVMDLQGFSTSHFGSNYRHIVREVIGDEQHVFPETLAVMFLVNTPWAFRLIWSVLKGFIDPITVAKIKVLGYDYIGELKKYIDIDQIPAKYGGKGTMPIKLGHCSDLPHDRYPLDYYDKKQQQTKDTDEQKSAQ